MMVKKTQETGWYEDLVDDEKVLKPDLKWSYATVCPACGGSAVYLRGKLSKLRIKCECCGHQPFQSDKGQILLENRLQLELSGGTPEGLHRPIQEIEETRPEPIQETTQEPIKQIQEDKEIPKGKKRGYVLCSLMLMTGGVGWIIWQVKKTAQAHS